MPDHPTKWFGEDGRPTWEKTWLHVADVMAQRSRCDGAQVGAVIVDKNNRPVSTGYNGPPAGYPVPDGKTCESWCTRRMFSSREKSYGLACPTVHAEANALMFADRRTYEGGTIYVTASCCADCAKLIANSGIARVVMAVRPQDAHRDPESVVKFLEDCGLRVTVV
uniref:Deoxycytidylate deaminase n=1 Tax=Micrococcus phage Kurnik TaxID=3092208 RepID=A0AAU6R6L7_9CAUD